jgi:2-desacetyl-2-hydroxyethyl bacteriochlorophyllide A dehydrogenase
VQAVVIEKPGDMSLKEVPDPVPGPEELVVAVKACGICGTDLHIFDGEFGPARYPLIPGHEFAGEVVSAGEWAPGGLVGRTVAVDPSVFCGRCRPCREGRGNLCDHWNALGDTMPGACAELVAVPYWNARPLPAGFDMSLAALVEPLSCAVHGYDILRPKLGDRFCIYGAGTMGLLLVALGPHVGAVSVSVVEPNPRRRELALAMGASEAVGTSAELGEQGGYDVVIDATGVVGAVEDALGHVSRGGKFLQFGVTAEDAVARFSPFRLYNDEQTFSGSMAVLHSFDRAADIAVRLPLELERLVTDRFPLSSYAEALEHVRRGEGLKTQVLPGGGPA